MSAGSKPVAVVGSINIDLVTNTKRIPVRGETVVGSGFQIHSGGKGANQALAVARLGYPVCMIGRIGDDAFGQQLRTHLEQAGVNVAGVITTTETSGVATIIVADSGENCIVITPGANALLTPEDIDANVGIIRSSGVVLTQLEIPLETVEHLAGICAREGIPLILDPEYHYESVNAETQRLNTSSLLWFMKRIINMRKRYKAFGRGNLNVLNLENPKVFAFTRTYEEETILVLVNLSKFPQPAEVDLSDYKGYNLIEVVSRNKFPKVKEDGYYFFTLAAYAFHWFALEKTKDEIQ